MKKLFLILLLFPSPILAAEVWHTPPQVEQQEGYSRSRTC